MEEEKEGRGGGVMKNLSFPTDLLQRFMCSSSTSRSSNVVQDVRDTAFRGDEEEEEDPEELELSLGLSLGGRFGTDRSKKNNLGRSSSIIGTVPFVRDISFGGGGGGDDSSSPAPAMSYPMLMRTSSLPVETEEEWRKRKEIQTMRRMAAKRRRSAKQRNSAGAGGKATEREDEVSAGVAASPSVSRQNTIGGGVDLAAVVAVAVAARSRQLNSQASAESPVGSSSGISELDNRVGQGSSSYGETRSPTGHQMSMERSLDTTGPAGPPVIKTVESKCSTSRSKVDPGPGPGGSKGREIGTNAVEDMPCVFTKGDGPNGRRVDGILYRYGKGEEVRIMCVCHGKFLSPAEFVKHAGGGDVDNPLRHIVINPSAASFL